jgi:hypothetical protein
LVGEVDFDWKLGWGRGVVDLGVEGRMVLEEMRWFYFEKKKELFKGTC